MTPRERLAAIKAGHPFDRLRCVPSISNTAARVIGCKVSELRRDGETLAQATIATYRRFGYDTVRVFTDLYVQPEAMGAKVRVPLDETAHLDAPAINTVAEIAALTPHNPHADGPLPALLQATRLVYEALHDEVPVTCAVEGPFTLAALLVGAETISRWMFKEPAAVHQLLEIAYRACSRLATAIIEIGATPSLTDAMSSSTVISPKHFREFALPYLKRLVGDIRARSGAAPGLHICGKTAPIWEGMVESGASCLSLDNLADLRAAKESVGDRVCLMGNIPPSEVLLLGTPADVRRAALKCIREAGDNPGGFILASGCSLPTETPFANIDAMMDTVREVGEPVAERLAAIRAMSET
ncbi:methylcobamide--CoM methyltransferase [Planctomycetales bacterium]|nr:methylcobamide--CoM methyltransferase [Planctomycetales bacterium]